ncbi:MAG: tol-pal system protein YbgF [Deltaproteobacteria bacterium]|nr:tol-pal system protein YbgF [Deltaproteobacteria bacterium]
MKRPSPFHPFLALAVLAAPACVTTKEEGDLMRRDLGALRDKVAQESDAAGERTSGIDRRLKDVEERLREMDQSQKQLDERNSRNKADFGAELQTLQSEFATLKGTLETKEYQLRERELQLGASQEQVRALESRIGELEKKVHDLEVKPAAVAAPAPAPAPVPAAPAPPPKPNFPAERQALYDFAKKAFDDGDPALAREGFEKFIKAFPKDKDLLDNAYFWAGETHYAQKAYDKAILSYQKVITDFPKSEKADAALFKMGLSFSALTYDDDARVFFEELLQKHPKSPLAKDAKAKLDELAKRKKAAPKPAPKPAPAKKK